MGAKESNEKALEGIYQCEQEAKGRGTWDGKRYYHKSKFFGGWTPPKKGKAEKRERTDRP